MDLSKRAEELLKKRLKNARNWAARAGMAHDHLPDFAQFCAMRWLEGRQAHLHHLYVDYFRHYHGDSRYEKSRGKWKMVDNTTLEGLLSYEMDEERIWAAAELTKLRRHLGKMQSRIFDMLMAGRTKADVSRILKCSDANVSIHWKKIVSQIMAHVSAKEGNA